MTTTGYRPRGHGPWPVSEYVGRVTQRDMIMYVLGRRSFIKANAAALSFGVLPRRHTFPQDPSVVSYLLRYDPDRAGRVVVTMTPPPQQGPVQLVLPRSIPMGYG